MLKVLFVEDSPEKKGKILDLLSQRTDLFVSPCTALCANEALERLRSERFDLLIADVIIPSVLNGERSEMNCIAMLEEVDALPSDKGAAYVVPVSAVDGLSNLARDFFRGRPWGIIPYREETDSCVNDIVSIAEWILGRSDVPHDGGEKCDVFIISALEDPEFSAVEGRFSDGGSLQPLDSKQLVRFTKIQSGGRVLTVAAAFCARMGPVAAAVLTSKVLQQLRPKLVIMAGICAGFPGKANIGDVVAADLSWDWQSGKHVDSSGSPNFQIAPHQIGIDDQIRTRLQLFKRKTTFWDGFAAEARDVGVSVPRLVIGHMASGASVLASASIMDQIKAQQKNVVGLDMETYAVYAAAAAHPESIKFVSLKAVCDNGDAHKGDGYQKFAAKVSAGAVVTFIEDCGAELL
jgi:nucleoside phosphorylase/CheY-like chemotaxis protein